MRLFIGYDPFESEAYEVCRRSFRKHHPDWQIARLDLDLLRVSGVFHRPYDVQGPGYYDLVEERPFSTAFAFSRFLVPFLCGFQGSAMFCDSDFLWRRDLTLWQGAPPFESAVAVVKHEYHPPEGEKIRGQSQTDYPRKNWSSMIVWNCGHLANRCLTPEFVTNKPGRYLHGFRWLDDDDILGLPESFNWLEGHSTSENPVAVHYTNGTPPRLIDRNPGAKVPYADEWFAYVRERAAA
jgi:hypothetical protein